MRMNVRTSPRDVPARWFGWSFLVLATALIGCDDGVREAGTVTAPPGALEPADEEWTRDVPPENQLSPEQYEALEYGSPPAADPEAADAVLEADPTAGTGEPPPGGIDTPSDADPIP